MDDILQLSEIAEEENKDKYIQRYADYKQALLQIGEEAGKERWLKCYSKDIDFRADLLPDHAQKEQIRISPELSVVWEAIKGQKTAKESQEAAREFLGRKGVCKEIEISRLKQAVQELIEEEQEENLKYIWFATTKNSIDIRPGLLDEEKPVAMVLGDDSVHALMAGRTGSGKSNALHALITGLMYEYAPWELNINLADFKIVEMSKYGNGQYEEKGELKSAAAPHVSKIAATDSMEYVLSIMYDMYEKMDMRQKVFAALGVQKLSQYREMFDVVLPREILIVDEFQQMYELATAKQTEIINQLIKMVTKLGRATGYHLLFASQSMTGTVRNDVLANFKLRMCLPASDEVSSMVLGNHAAAELTGAKSKGYIITNAEGGGIDDNKEFKIPLLKESKEEQGDLGRVLEENAKLAEKIGYRKEMDFYREELVRPLWGETESLEADFDLFFKNTREAVAADDEIEEYLLLGDSCVFAKDKYKQSSLEYTPIKTGDRKNILCIGDSIYQRAYMLELLGVQYKKREKNKNYIVHGDHIVKSLLSEDEGSFFEHGKWIEEIPVKEITNKIVNDFNARDSLQKFIQYPYEKRTKEKLDNLCVKSCCAGVLEKLIRLWNKEFDKTMELNIKMEYSDLRHQVEENQKILYETGINGNQKKRLEEIKFWFEEMESCCDVLWKMYQTGLRDEKFHFKNLKSLTYWINGYHMLSDLMEKWGNGKQMEMPMADIMKRCTNMGMRFILVGTKIDDIPAGLRKNFEYLFLITNDENNFAKAFMQRPKEYRDNVMHFKAVNETLNRQKPSLYILPQDEKLVKLFEIENERGKSKEEIFFKDIK